jgi:hypothetical protein
MVAACLLAAAMPVAALTLPIYQATASATSRPTVADSGDASASADNGVFYPGDGKGSSARASGSGQGLKVFATAGIPQQPAKEPFGSLSVAAGGSARMRFDDVVFSASDADVPAGLIPVSLNLAIDGSFSLLQQGTSNASARGGLSVDYGLGVPGPGSTAVPYTVANLRRERDRGISLWSNNGFFDVLGDSDAWTIDGSFQTPTFLVPVDTPLLLTVVLSASATVVTRDGAPVNAVTAFDHTLRFPLDGPVFNLPEGYRADSLQAGIVNNVSAVPLPPTLWLFAAGLAAIGVRLRPRGGAGAALRAADQDVAGTCQVSNQTATAMKRDLIEQIVTLSRDEVVLA